MLLSSLFFLFFMEEYEDLEPMSNKAFARAGLTASSLIGSLLSDQLHFELFDDRFSTLVNSHGLNTLGCFFLYNAGRIFVSEERASRLALGIYGFAAATEFVQYFGYDVGQLLGPEIYLGLTPVFDPYDLVAFAVGVGGGFLVDKLFLSEK